MNCKADNSLMPLRTYFEADENWGQGSAPKFDSSNLTSELGESELWGAKNVDAKLLGTFGIVREPTLFFLHENHAMSLAIVIRETKSNISLAFDLIVLMSEIQICSILFVTTYNITIVAF